MIDNRATKKLVKTLNKLQIKYRRNAEEFMNAVLYVMDSTDFDNADWSDTDVTKAISRARYLVDLITDRGKHLERRLVRIFEGQRNQLLAGG